MITRGRLTAEDLLRMPDGECRRELIHGEIVEMPLTNPLHSRLVARLAYFLEEHIDKHGGGLVFAGDPGFVLNLPYDPERVRGPDLAFVPGVTSTRINQWIEGDTNFDNRIDPTRTPSGDAPEARIFTIDRYTALLRAVEVQR